MGRRLVPQSTINRRMDAADDRVSRELRRTAEQRKILTHEQKSLARHALGLPNKDKRSYRNRFCAGPGHEDYAEWVKMLGLGYAERRDGRTLPYGGDDLFRLTRRGALLALEYGETLCPEDFA